MENLVLRKGIRKRSDLSIDLKETCTYLSQVLLAEGTATAKTLSWCAATECLRSTVGSV